jgi:gliding motility-associated-like protein
MHRLYIFLILYFLLQEVFAQSYVSKNNYTGNWETPTTWSPVWSAPQTTVSCCDITINGYITVNGPLSFIGTSRNLVVNDTLVILGNLLLDNNTSVSINGNGIVIVWGNLIINNSTNIITNGYLVVTGDVIKNSSTSLGSLIANGNPLKVFVGGAISPASLTDNNPLYPALNCTSPATIPYPNSNCGYGNMTDFMDDPLYPFFLTTCSITTPTITASGPTTFCAGGSVTLTSSTGSTYLWSTGATTQSINVTTSGSYTVRVTNATGCMSEASAPKAVIVYALPATPTITAEGPTTFCAGNSVTLTSSAGTTYLWSTGATTESINVTTSGSYTVRVTNANGCQSAASAPKAVTVNPLPATPTITAEGPTTFCAGNSVTLTSSAGTTYLWSTGATTESINVTTSGSYKVRVTNVNGCQSAESVATIVTVNPLPATPTITAGGPTTFCDGDSVTLTSSSGSTYLWSNGAITQSINVATSGSYTARVTNANGCQSAESAATIVTANPLPATPAITAGGPTTFCAGDSVTLTSSAESGYLWSNGATTQSINVTTSGSYTVKVTNASGCLSEASAPRAVTVHALPATPTITAGGPTAFCDGDSVTLTSSAGTTYLWSTGDTSQSIDVTATGNYTVQITNESGCQSAASVATAVTVNPLPATPIITAGGPTTLCAGDSVTLTSSTGSTYLWSTGATTQSINVNTAGSYTVRMTNANGCQSPESLPTIININSLPVVDAGSDTTIPNGTSTTLNATVTGTGPFAYSWTPQTELVNASVEDPTTVNLAYTTVFILTATSSATTCSNSDTVMVSITGGPLNASPTATPGVICSGLNVQLDAMAGGGSGSYTYTWTSTPGGFTSSLASPVANPAVSTTYNVAVYDGFNTVNSQVSVTVNPLPATPTIIAGGPTTFCDGGSVTLTSSTGIGYLWSNGETTPSINVTTPGSYSVQVNNASGCLSIASAATVVTVNALPVTPVITASGPTTFCDGGSVTLTSSAGSGYLWSNGETTPSINVTTPGSYSVQVTNASGCQSAVSVATIVTVNPLPATPVITAGGPTTFCDGSSVTLTSSAGSDYLWSNGETTPSINVTTPGSYAVQITNSNGCESEVSEATVVTVNPLPVTPAITAGGPTTFCDGGSVTLTSSAGSDYLWSNGEITPSINVTTPGSYSVQVTNASGCQSAVSVATIVTVNALPVTPVITAGGPTTFCDGGSVTLTSSAGSAYLWSNGETTPGINATTPGSYSVQVTNASGCQSAASVATIVTVNALPATPVITASGPTTFCEGSSVTLISDAAAIYLWSDGETSESINVTTAGNYTVQVTNANGCESEVSETTVVTVNALPATPTITAGGPTTFCDGGSVNLTSSAGSGYLWSNGETTTSINVTTPGSYSVQVINASGCESEASAATVVTVNPLPVTPVITAGGSTTFCDGGSVTLTSSAGSGYLWSNGETTPSINVTKPGSYSVQIQDENGCSSLVSLPAAIMIIDLPVVNITSSDAPMCTNDLRTLTGTPDGGIFTLISGPGNITGNTLTATGPGTIEIEYNYTGACANKALQTVIANENPVANAGPDQELGYVNETQMQAVLSSSETGEWSLISGLGNIHDIYSPTTGVTGLSAGVNVFLWKVQNDNCEASAEVRLIVNELFIPSVITPNGDGKNDYFKINEGYEKFELIIFNRWGNIEYTNDNYIDKWDGRNNKGAYLTNDTYFYVVKFKNGEIKKGSVLIKK